MAQYAVDKIVDCKGLSCPMPVVRTKKAIEDIQPGQVLGVIATDPGSVADMKSWASRTGHHFLGTEEHEGTYRHYIRRSHSYQTAQEKHYERTISNEALLEKLAETPFILDVREPDEFASGHIPDAKSVPLGQLEYSIEDLKSYVDDEVYVVCRSGSRSEAACHILAKHGFKNAVNVSAGMKTWNGPTVGD